MPPRRVSHFQERSLTNEETFVRDVEGIKDEACRIVQKCLSLKDKHPTKGSTEEIDLVQIFETARMIMRIVNDIMKLKKYDLCT